MTDSVRVFDMGKGGKTVVVRSDLLPGQPMFGFVEPGKPESDLQDKIEACTKALHAEIITQSQEFDIL